MLDPNSTFFKVFSTFKVSPSKSWVHDMKGQMLEKGVIFQHPKTGKRSQLMSCSSIKCDIFNRKRQDYRFLLLRHKFRARVRGQMSFENDKFLWARPQKLNVCLKPFLKTEGNELSSNLLLCQLVLLRSSLIQRGHQNSQIFPKKFSKQRLQPSLIIFIFKNITSYFNFTQLSNPEERCGGYLNLHNYTTTTSSSIR